MKKVLYISNIEVPYRTEFFNQLSKEVDLTVLYEREKSSNRDSNWEKSKKSCYSINYLSGINYRGELTIDFHIIKYLKQDYDCIIFGCINSITQIYGMLYLKRKNRSFYINVDGEYYFDSKSLKNKVKLKILNLASGVFIAGDKSAEKVKKIVSDKNVYPYYFSSLTKKEIGINRELYTKQKDDYVLIVGQYLRFKGINFMFDVAKMLPNIKFKYVGAGSKSQVAKEYISKNNIANVEIIPFLSKDKLSDVYKKCRLFVLPSEKECWGLVINEAASFGAPIISTYGCGCAVEYLSGSNYEKYLVSPNNKVELVKAISNLYYNNSVDDYVNFLLDKSKEYYIEKNVEVYLDVINNI